jgi:hypothetical protein
MALTPRRYLGKASGLEGLSYGLRERVHLKVDATMEGGGVPLAKYVQDKGPKRAA